MRFSLLFPFLLLQTSNNYKYELLFLLIFYACNLQALQLYAYSKIHHQFNKFQSFQFQYFFQFFCFVLIRFYLFFSGELKVFPLGFVAARLLEFTSFQPKMDLVHLNFINSYFYWGAPPRLTINKTKSTMEWSRCNSQKTDWNHQNIIKSEILQRKLLILLMKYFWITLSSFNQSMDVRCSITTVSSFEPQAHFVQFR